MAKTKTKTEIRNDSAKAQRILRGIDNNVAAAVKLRGQADKKLAQVVKDAAEIRGIVAGISNAALAPPSTSDAKKDTPKPTKAEAKKATPKPAKKATPAKAKSPAKEAASEDLNVNRPDLDGVIHSILEKAGKALTAAEVYHGCQQLATAKGFKVWSRQSLYNQLKNVKRFSKTGDGAAARFGNADKSDSEADKFVEKVARDSVAASVS